MSGWTHAHGRLTHISWRPPVQATDVRIAAFLTFVESNSNFPSIMEFRDAPPFNRLRFASLFVTVLLLEGPAGAARPTSPRCSTKGSSAH